MRKIILEKKNLENIDNKSYKTIEQCETIFALLSPLDRNREKDSFIESNEKVCVCALGIDSKVSRSHCTQGMWPFQSSRKEKKFVSQYNIHYLNHPNIIQTFGNSNVSMTFCKYGL